MIRHACLAFTLVGFLACSDGAAESLSFERPLSAGASFTANLVSYRNDGLKLHAMIAVPRSDAPVDGFPVVIANHGYVPDPREYGITADGNDSRPGDYYRSVPELFASRGFLVVIPDYRGHNSSEGFEQIEGQNMESVELYAADVIALLELLGDIDDVDQGNVFMWSHSMGGAVSMRVLLATKVVKAASFWSTASVEALAGQFENIESAIVIQHAQHDTTTPHANAALLGEALARTGKAYSLHSYATDNHFFDGPVRELAADRDAAFFRQMVNNLAANARKK
ncbi:MAG: alpha/beta fold hydrolase [Gammaproteobacteria bacterium]|nr:alpha/beta fold hydrolase [Gammaproteobacteria bacterium]